MTTFGERTLWWIYGFTYDGLRHFYPYQQLIKKVADKTAPMPHEAILDLGCGTGNILEALSKRQPTLKLTAVDISATMVARARRKTQKLQMPVAFTVTDIESFMALQPDNCFDKIVSVNVIYAINNREKLWQDVRRVLKPGGQLIIATSIKTGSSQIIREHLDHAPRYQLLHPKLIGVSIVDSLIDRFAHHGTFPFPQADTLRQELAAVNLTMGPAETCYGGVDILFEAK